MPEVVETFRLGKDCEFRLNGTLLTGVREASTKRKVKTTDATGPTHSAESSVVTHRTYEIDVEVTRKPDFDALAAAEDDHAIVQVVTEKGFRNVAANFTVHESESQEPLDEGVVGRFTLKQWMWGEEA